MEKQEDWNMEKASPSGWAHGMNFDCSSIAEEHSANIGTRYEMGDLSDLMHNASAANRYENYPPDPQNQKTNKFNEIYKMNEDYFKKADTISAPKPSPDNSDKKLADVKPPNIALNRSLDTSWGTGRGQGVQMGIVNPNKSYRFHQKTNASKDIEMLANELKQVEGFIRQTLEDYSNEMESLQMLSTNQGQKDLSQELLRKRLIDVTQQLLILSKKPMTKKTEKTTRKSKEKQVSALVKEIDKAERELEALELSKASNEHLEVSEKEASLQVELNKVFIRKREISEQIRSENEKLHQLLESKALTKEDLNAHLSQRAELVAQYEELDMVYEEIKETNKQQVLFVNEEIDITKKLLASKDHLKALGDAKIKVSQELETVVRKIIGYNEEHLRFGEKIKEIGSDRESDRHEISNMLDQVIEIISVNFSKMGLPDFQGILNLLKSAFSTTVELKIVKEHFAVISREEEHQERLFGLEMASVEKEIKETSNIKDQPTAKKMKGSLLERLQTTQSFYQKKLKEIKELKGSLKEIITHYEVNRAKDLIPNEEITTEQVLKYIHEIVYRKTGDAGVQLLHESFSGLLTQMIKIIEKKEAINQEKIKAHLEIRKEIEALEDRVFEAQLQRRELENKIWVIDEESRVGNIENKHLVAMMNERRVNTEHEIFREAEKVFLEYIAHQAGAFETLCKTYGTKQAGQVRKTQKKEFIEKIVVENKKSLENLRKLQQSLAYYNYYIGVNTHYIDERIMPELNAIGDKINDVQAILRRLKKEEIGIMESEEQIATEIEMIQEAQANQRKPNVSLEAIEKVKERHLGLVEKLMGIINEKETEQNDEVTLDEEKRMAEAGLLKELEQIEKQIAEKTSGNGLKGSSLNEKAMSEKTESLRVLRDQLDELEMRRLSLEHKLLEVNFNLAEDLDEDGAFSTQDPSKMPESFKKSSRSGINEYLSRLHNQEKTVDQDNSLAHQNFNEEIQNNTVEMRAKPSSITEEKFGKSGSMVQLQHHGVTGSLIGGVPSICHNKNKSSGGDAVSSAQFVSANDSPVLQKPHVSSMIVQWNTEQEKQVSETAKSLNEFDPSYFSDRFNDIHLPLQIQDTSVARLKLQGNQLSSQWNNGPSANQTQAESMGNNRSNYQTSHKIANEMEFMEPPGSVGMPEAEDHSKAAIVSFDGDDDEDEEHEHDAEPDCEDPYNYETLVIASQSKHGGFGNFGLDADEEEKRGDKEDMENDIMRKMIQCPNSITCKIHRKGYQLKTEECSREEIDLFEKIRVIVDGSQLYKRYMASISSLKTPLFNPMNQENMPPDACGYISRIICFNVFTLGLEVRNSLKGGIEMNIPLESISKCVDHPTTSNLIRSKYSTNFSRQSSVPNLHSATAPVFYPFSLLLAKSGRIELIATNYEDYVAWTEALSLIVEKKKMFVGLCSKFRCICI